MLGTAEILFGSSHWSILCTVKAIAILYITLEPEVRADHTSTCRGLTTNVTVLAYAEGEIPLACTAWHATAEGVAYVVCEGEGPVVNQMYEAPTRLG